MAPRSSIVFLRGAFARARCAAATLGWVLVPKECTRVQFFDALRFYWAHGQRCCSVAVYPLLMRAYRLAKAAGCGPENLFSFCFLDVSKERIFR